MVRLRANEPLFQSKRRFVNSSEFNLAKHHEIPKQDDYFIIGPSDAKFAPSIAYRNREKYRSKSNSPSRLKNSVQEEKQPVKVVDKSCGTPFKKTTSDYDNPDKQFKRRNGLVYRKPREALAEEITRIRSDLEKQKRKLRSVSPVKRTNSENYQDTTKLNLRFNDYTQERVENNHQRNPMSIEAPRTVNPRHKSDQLVEYLGRKISHSPFRKRPRSASPRKQPHQSEYQHAYKAPSLIPCQTTHETTPMKAQTRPKTAYHRRPFATTQMPYETEYRKEYRSFKYVPEGRLHTNFVDKTAEIHNIPIRRPRSACLPAVTSAGIQHTSARNSECPQVKRSSSPQPNRGRTKRYRSEYSAQYRSYSVPRQAQNTCVNQLYPIDWLQQLGLRRENAEAYRQRHWGSHFTRNHLAQLDSEYVTMWDPPSSNRPAISTDLTVYETIGKPVRGQESVTVATRRKAMFDSHHIAEALDLDIDWSSTDSECPTFSLNNLTQQIKDSKTPNNPVTVHRPTSTSILGRDHQTVTLPQRQVNARQSSKERKVDQWIGTQSSDPIGGSSSIGGQSYLSEYRRNHGSHNAPYTYADRQDRVLRDETGSVSSISPLSARSMASSASLAAATLARARKQHQRIFTNMHGADEHVPRAYTPEVYAG